MGKIVVTKNRGMSLWAKFALVTLSSLLLSAFIDKPAFALNPIMHNSSTTSNKFGSWGQDKNCTWCHTSGATANVKMVSQSIATPSGPRNVIFYRMTASFNNYTGVLGNDARTYSLNASTNVCEVCHLQTAFHLYSSDVVQSENHYNNKYCTECHIHADGFKPNRHAVPYYADGGGHPTCASTIGCHTNTGSDLTYPTSGSPVPTPPDCRVCHTLADPAVAENGCGSCHGTISGNGEPTGAAHPNVQGSHVVHTGAWYIDHAVTCADCHTTGGSGGKTDHGKGNRDANPAVVNLDSGFGVSGVEPNLTCSTTPCHASPYGPGSVPSPAWGTSVGCAACHSGTPGAFQGNGAPNTGSHNKHLAIPAANCNQCHDSAISGISGGASHLDGNVDVTFVGYSANVIKRSPGSYSSCSNASCHVSPYGTTQVVSPVWGASAGCAACHKDNGAFIVFGGPSTGSHKAHLKLANSACNQCHEGAVRNENGGLTHANDTVDVSNDYTGSPVVKHPAGSYSGYCMSATCHASPYGAGPVNSPVWGVPTGCASCHTAAGAFVANGAPNTGSHAKHMALNNATCGKCHDGTVSGENPGNTHSNGFINVTSGYTAKNVTPHPIGTYAGTCANSCHTNGNNVQVASPRWGVAMATNCTGCHGGSSNVTPVANVLKTGKHRSHMNNYSALGKGNNLKCAECHATTVSLASNTVITNSANHVNSYKNYSGVKAGGSSNYSLATGVCSTVYCHSNGQSLPIYKNMTGSKAWASSAKFDCSGCHGSDGDATWSSNFGAPNYTNNNDGTMNSANSHERHTLIAGTTDSRGCAKCHNKTVDRGIAGKLRDYSTLHLNKTVDVSFSIYGNYSSRDKTCNTYCHSNVQGPSGVGEATAYSRPLWGDNGSMTCGNCHADMSTLAENPTNLLLGSHKRHTVDAGYDCAKCHGAAYSSASADTITHADDTINVVFTGERTQGTTYSQGSNVPGSGYGSCSTSKCHGRATRNWGISTTLTSCEKCHGSSRTAIEDGKFKDTAGADTGSYVGTHVSHLAGTHNLTSPIQCNECHVVPASIDSFDHMSSLPATISWGALSVRNARIRGYTSAAQPMVPAYVPATRACNNTYCHAGVQIKDATTGIVTYQGTKPNPKWGESAFACNMCHGWPPKGTHTASQNCNACHAHVDASNVAMADKTQHIDGLVQVTADDCLICHSSEGCTPAEVAAGTCVNKELVGGHKTHTNSELFLKNANGTNKTLSAGDYIDPSWIYGITYKKGFPQYACGFCHPMEMSTHKNGLVEIDLDPAHALRGSVKTKNKAGGPWVVSYVAGDSVTCNNVYCHSSGFVSPTTQSYQFKPTPDWYYADKNGKSFWAGKDSCAECHGNSPNTGGTEGSSAHARHVVANHFKDVFDNYSAKLKYAGKPGTGAVHGDPATATNFNCNVCHFDTVRSAFNDQGSVCIDCHASPRKPSMMNYSAVGMGKMLVYSGSIKHVNGDVDVVFSDPFVFKSKAQLRNSISSVQSVYTSWTRVNGYKAANSYDLARQKPQYVGGTCLTTSCHNGTQMEWRTKGPLACAACHVGLPQ